MNNFIMKQKSVFDYLRARRFLDKSSTRRKYNFNRDPGKEILEEFYRSGGLKPNELDLSLEFLCEEHNNHKHIAINCINAAKKSTSKKRACLLKKAGKSITEARRNLLRMQKIDPEYRFREPGYTVNLGHLDDLSEDLHIINEYPENYEAVLSLTCALRKYVREEDYESAAQVRDMIRKEAGFGE